MKAALYDTAEACRAAIASVEASLGIPSGVTTRYAQPEPVTNEESSDFGKFVLPVKVLGTWKCDQLFEPSELVDWDASWFETEGPE